MKYIIKSTEMEDARRINTPIACGIKLSKRQQPQVENDESSTDKTLYKSMLGKLGHLATKGAPTLMFAASLFGRFQSNPGKIHQRYLKRSFKYIKKLLETKAKIRYNDTINGEMKINIYVD